MASTNRTSALVTPTLATNSNATRGRIIACSSHAERLQIGNLPAAVGERVEPYAHLLEQRQMKIGERCRLLVSDVPCPFLLAGPAPGQDDREVGVIVDVGVSHAAAQ